MMEDDQEIEAYPTVWAMIAAVNDSSNEVENDDEQQFTNGSAVNLFINATMKAGGRSRPYPMSLKVLEFLNLHYLGLMIIVGILGNAKNVFSFCRSRKSKLRSPSYYLAALALADTIFLTIFLILWLNHFELNLFGHPVAYKILLYLSSLSSCMSAWFVAAFTFERLIIVRYPLKRAQICTVRRAKLIIGCITIAAALVQTVSLFTTGITSSSKTSANNITASNINFNITTAVNITRPISGRRDSFFNYYQMMRFVNMLETFLTVAVPPIGIVIMNALIVRSLIRFNRTFQADANRHRSRSSSLTAQSQHQVNLEMRTLRVTSEATRRQSLRPGGSPADSGNGVIQNETNRQLLEREGRTRNPLEQLNGGSGSIMKYTATMAVLRERHAAATGNLSTRTRTTSVISTEICTPPSENNASIVAVDNEDDSISRRTGGDNEILGEREPAAAQLRNRQQQQQHVNMDAIEIADTVPGAIDDQECQPQLQQPPANTNATEEAGDDSRRSNNRTEYVITRKLVIISTVHILLNLPSYVIGLKIFIDETVRPGDPMTFNTWIIQQYSLLLYYTNIGINFLLYSTSSTTFRNQLFCKCCCKRRRTSHQSDHLV